VKRLAFGFMGFMSRYYDRPGLNDQAYIVQNIATGWKFSTNLSPSVPHSGQRGPSPAAHRL